MQSKITPLLVSLVWSFCFSSCLIQVNLIRQYAKQKSPSFAEGVIYLCGERGIACGDPLGRVLQSLNKPCRVLFILPLFLQKAGFLRNLVKINNPADAGFIQALRREGDSNPRFRDSRTTVFETAAFDHSAISPIYLAAFTMPINRDHISPIFL